MKILLLHCDYVSYKPKKVAIKKGADEVTTEDLEGKRIEEVLAVFTSIEQGDSDKEIEDIVKEVKKVYDNVGAKNLLLYPYAHLSSNLASLDEAPKVLLKLWEALKKGVNAHCYKSQFGWYKEFELKCKGHPLAELSKHIGTLPAGAQPKGPKKGDQHSINEVIYSVMLEEPRNVGFAQDRNAYRLTAALALAAMLKKEDPSVQVGLSSLTENGFYVDVDLKKSVTPQDRASMLDRLKVYVKHSHKIEQRLVSKDQAVKVFQEQNATYLLELAQKIPDHAFLNLYFLDGICLPSVAPLLDNTSKLKAIHLSDSSAAYWLKDSSKPQLQRIYGFSFAESEALNSFLEMQEKAKDRDHRKLGQELDLFSVQDVAPGMAFFHPKGMVIRNEIEKYWRALNDKYEYVEIRTPIIMDSQVWKDSGHWDHYKENMYFTSIDGKLNGVKPMNCPGSIRVFKTSKRSYRDLPLRLSELGLVHRHELSGVLSGLFRVRAFTQDDSHVFCTREQVRAEVEKRLRFIDEFYKMFGFEYSLELSTRPPKRLGSDADWDQAESALKDALVAVGKQYKLNEGDGAFYGPKIDFHIKDSLGRSWQCATEQLDFQMPMRFDVKYEGADAKEHHPVILHSVAQGSFERFFAILIEHFEGKFPLWLAPVQVVVLAISDDQNAYADKILHKLKLHGVRVEFDQKSATIGNKIRHWQMQKVPYMVIVGKNELESNTVSIRVRSGEETRNVKIDEFAKQLENEIRERK